MENQINIGDQNIQHSKQNSANKLQTTQEKPQVNYWMIVALVLLVVLFILSGLYIFALKNKLVEKTAQQSSVTNLKENYKSYTNKVYGFSFKYPNNFILNPEIWTSTPETSMIIMLGENKLPKDVNPSEKYRSVVIGHTKGVNKETCNTHADSYRLFTTAGYNDLDPDRVSRSEVAHIILGTTVKGVLEQEKVETNSTPGVFEYRTDYEKTFPLCVNNKYFEIRFQYNGYTGDELNFIKNDELQDVILNTFQLLDKEEMVNPPVVDRLGDEEKQLLSSFQSQILPSNSAIKKELNGKQIIQIFGSGGIYIVTTEPEGFIQGPILEHEGAINIYAVNKNSYVALVKAGHDILHVSKVYFPRGLETKRMVVQLGGGADFSELYLLDITKSIKIIKFTDSKNYSGTVKEITKMPLVSIGEDGSIYTEEFKFKNSLMETFDMDVGGTWGVYLTTDLITGQLTKMRIEKNPLLNGNNNPNGKTEVVFDN